MIMCDLCKQHTTCLCSVANLSQAVDRRWRCGRSPRLWTCKKHDSCKVQAYICHKYES